MVDVTTIHILWVGIHRSGFHATLGYASIILLDNNAILNVNPISINLIKLKSNRTVGNQRAFSRKLR
jgi:hypothetical protein